MRTRDGHSWILLLDPRPSESKCKGLFGLLQENPPGGGSELSIKIARPTASPHRFHSCLRRVNSARIVFRTGYSPVISLWLWVQQPRERGPGDRRENQDEVDLFRLSWSIPAAALSTGNRPMDETKCVDCGRGSIVLLDNPDDASNLLSSTGAWNRHKLPWRIK